MVVFLSYMSYQYFKNCHNFFYVLIFLLRRAKNSIGILEMGGGSLQVAFIPNEPLYESEFQVYIGTRRYDLYAHSYLGFGSNYLKKQVLSQLIKQYCDGEMAQLNCKNGNSTLISDPCMLSG